MWIVLLAGCGSSETAREAPPEPVAPPVTAEPEEVTPPVAPTSIDARDQYALALEMLASEAAEHDAQAATFAEVREGWEGRRYRWTMARAEGLCAQPASCLMMPFDHARFPHQVYYAFLATLRFRPEAHAAMATACAAHAQGCAVTFEGTLEHLGFTVDGPASLTLEDVGFVEARAARDGEFWGAHPPGQPAGPALSLFGSED